MSVEATEADHVETPPEAVEYFAATIGEYSCRNCGTEFKIDSLLFATRDLAGGVECPICGTHAEADALEFGSESSDDEEVSR